VYSLQSKLLITTKKEGKKRPLFFGGLAGTRTMEVKRVCEAVFNGGKCPPFALLSQKKKAKDALFSLVG